MVFYVPQERKQSVMNPKGSPPGEPLLMAAQVAPQKTFPRGKAGFPLGIFIKNPLDFWRRCSKLVVSKH